MADDPRLEKILGLLLVQLMKDADFPTKVRALVFANFSYGDIAEMLGNTTVHSVEQTAYVLRKGAGKAKRAKKRSKKKIR